VNGRPFSFADCEAVFGPECAELVEQRVKEAPRFTPEQILCGQRLFASFPLPRRPRPADERPADAA